MRRTYQSLVHAGHPLPDDFDPCSYFTTITEAMIPVTEANHVKNVEGEEEGKDEIAQRFELDTRTTFESIATIARASNALRPLNGGVAVLGIMLNED